MHRRRATPPQHPGAGRRRRAAGMDIIDQEDSPIFDALSVLQSKSTPHRFFPFAWGHAAQRTGATQTQQHSLIDRYARPPPQIISDQRRLIEAPRP